MATAASAFVLSKGATAAIEKLEDAFFEHADVYVADKSVHGIDASVDHNSRHPSRSKILPSRLDHPFGKLTPRQAVFDEVCDEDFMLSVFGKEFFGRPSIHDS